MKPLFNRAIFVVLMLLPSAASAQHTMRDFMNEECDVIWFGLDFSKAKLIGSDGFSDPVAIKEEYFDKWNQLMLNEADKYEWDKALLVSDLKLDTEMISAVNSQVKVKTLVTNKSYSLDKQEISMMVSSYDITSFSEGIGVVLVVESFNKV